VFWKKSIKTASTCTPKTGNLKKALLLFSHRVTRIGNYESRTFFDQMRKFTLLRGTPAPWDAPFAIPSGSVFETLWKNKAQFLLSPFLFLLCMLCALGSLWLELNQSKITNYAKQTQFPKCQK